MDWARYHANGFECSSKGDRRFSALYAKLQCGKTIEEFYQLDVKGYRSITNNWLDAKGKPPLIDISRETLYECYLELWRIYFQENPNLLEELYTLTRDKVLTDRFANSEINQARAISTILTEFEIMKEFENDL